MLNVSEIFKSIDGECNHWGQGALTTFIRLQGCNLHCDYCDTKHTQDGLKTKHLLEVEDIVKIIPPGKVTITGGEPLLQKEEVTSLISILNYDKHKVSIETNGSMRIPNSLIGYQNLSWIIDYKLHAQDMMNIDNFWNTISQDWIKFVIETPDDFQKACDVIESLKAGGCRARIAFSPVMHDSDLWPAQWLAERIIEKQIDISLNLQIHKLIWPNKPEGISLLSRISK